MADDVYLQDYCKHFNFNIKNNIIYDKDNIIGNINPAQKWAIIGNNKIKYSEFAILIVEGYFDLLGEK